MEARPDYVKQKIIKPALYKESEFSKDYQNLKKISDWIADMELTPENMNLVIEMFRHFGPAFLYDLEPLYLRIQDDPKKQSELSKTLKFISGYVKQIYSGNIPEELQFIIKTQDAKDPIPFRKLNHQELKLKRCLEDMKIRAEKITKMDKKDFRTQVQIGNFFDNIQYRNNPNFFESRAIEVCSMAVLSMFDDMKSFNSSLSEEDKEIRDLEKSTILFESAEITNNAKEDQKSTPRQPLVIKETPICCRTFFYSNEILDVTETETIEFKNYEFPYNTDCDDVLVKTMVSFLNRDGGTIYIGVLQDKRPQSRGRYQVIGSIYTQQEKEEVHKKFRNLAQLIYPDIIMDTRFSVKFVPIKSKKTNEFVMGKFIIKVVIKYGERDALYCAKMPSTKYQEVFFRGEKEVLRQPLSKVLEQQKRRATKKLPLPPRLHAHDCPPPESGVFLYHKKNQNNNNRYNNNNRNDDKQQPFKKKTNETPSAQSYNNKESAKDNNLSKYEQPPSERPPPKIISKTPNVQAPKNPVPPAPKPETKKPSPPSKPVVEPPRFNNPLMDTYKHYVLLGVQDVYEPQLFKDIRQECIQLKKYNDLKGVIYVRVSQDFDRVFEDSFNRLNANFSLGMTKVRGLLHLEFRGDAKVIRTQFAQAANKLRNEGFSFEQDPRGCKFKFNQKSDTLLAFIVLKQHEITTFVV